MARQQRPPSDPFEAIAALEARLRSLENSSQLGHSTARGGTARWADTSGVVHVTVGDLGDGTNGLSTDGRLAAASLAVSGALSAGDLSAPTAEVATSLAVGGGTPLTKVVVYAPSLTPTSVAAVTVSRQTFAVAGLTTADKVIVNPPAASGNVALCAARVSATDTLELTFTNPSAGSLTPTAGTYLVLAFRS